MKKTFLLLFLIVLLLSSPLIAQIDSVNQFEPVQFLLEPDEDKLAETLRVSIATDSSNIRNYLILGSILENQLKFDSAAVIFQKAAEIDSTCTSCFQRLAGVMTNQGKIRDALTCYKKSLSLDSTNKSARIQLARLLMRENRFNESIEHWRFLLFNDSVNYYIWEQMGDCASRMNETGWAWNSYMSSFFLNPQNLPVAAKIGQIGIQQKVPYDYYQFVIDSALTFDSLYIPLLRVKGTMFFNSKDYQNTIKFYQKAIEQGDSSRITLKHLGISLHMKKLFVESVPFLQKAYETDSTDIFANYVYAKSLNNADQPEKAIQILESTEKLLVPDPEELSTLYEEFGISHLLTGNYQLAISHYQKAYAANPAKIEYLVSIAQFYEEMLNDEKSALNYFMQFIERIEQLKLENVDVSKYEWDIEKAKNNVTRLRETLFFNDEL